MKQGCWKQQKQQQHPCVNAKSNICTTATVSTAGLHMYIVPECICKTEAVPAATEAAAAAAAAAAEAAAKTQNV